MVRRFGATKIIVIAAAVGFGGSQVAAEVATLKVQSGSVMVNHGQGFQSVVGEARVSPGDLVMVQPASLVNLVYDANPCAIPLAAEQVVVVAAEAQCGAGVANAAPTMTTQIALGAGVAAGVIGLAVAAGSKRKAASP